MARRSARLSSRNSSTPQPIKRVSLSHETPTLRAPRTVPSKLSSLHESDEMPGAFPGSASPSERSTPVPAKRMKRSTAVEEQTTPKNATPIKPSEEEMHPKHVHQTTTKPLDEARWLGFSDMPPATEPSKRGQQLAGIQQTPSKFTKASSSFKSPEFQFTFRREHSLELSPEAKRFMAEKRAEAMKIKEQMKSNRESNESNESSGEALGRKIATPKGKKGRFSDLHAAQFQKMDSIAGHASAFRKGPVTTGPSATHLTVATQTPSKSLKRSPSKAELDKNESTPSRTIPRSQSKSKLAQAVYQISRTPPATNDRAIPSEETSPAKRMKHAENVDVSATLPSSNMDKSLPSTPKHNKPLRIHPSNPQLSHLSTPTQSSLARAASTKSTKTTSMIPGPSLTRSPSKPQLVEPTKDSPKDATPLLARSPAKGGHVTSQGEMVEKSHAPTSPLLSRTPLKASVQPRTHHEKTGSRSPHEAQHQPLLARSPLKVSVFKISELGEPSNKQSSIPLLSKSPSKISLGQNPFESAPSHTPAKTTSKGLMGRFSLLRSSPVKSILRSPQRLYSNDPVKVAAGTHMATPPPKEKSTLFTVSQAVTAPVRKHVDFSLSTKEREVSKSASPSDGPTPPPKDDIKDESVRAPIADYPSLPTIASPFVNPTPERRRQTVAPSDFTFRAGDGIIFANSPHAPSSSAMRPQTIRHVSAEPALAPPPSAMGSKKRKYDFENKASAMQSESSPTHTQSTKKRKFDFENRAAVQGADAGSTSDKENSGVQEEEQEDGRPSKRAKITLPGKQAPEKPGKTATTLATLGVKPKGGAAGAAGSKEKKPSSISRARLNALAMPKRRG